MYVLNKDINSFFSKGDVVTIIKDWGELLYVSNGFHRVAVYRSEITQRPSGQQRKGQ